MDELYEKFVSILTEDFGVPEEQVSADATWEALELDSLDVVEITLAVEEQLGAKIEDEELEGIATVGDAVKAIAHKLGVAA